MYFISNVIRLCTFLYLFLLLESIYISHKGTPDFQCSRSQLLGFSRRIFSNGRTSGVSPIEYFVTVEAFGFLPWGFWWRPELWVLALSVRRSQFWWDWTDPTPSLIYKGMELSQPGCLSSVKKGLLFWIQICPIRENISFGRSRMLERVGYQRG